MHMSYEWRDVPVQVQKLFVKYAATAAELARTKPTIADYWILHTAELGPVLIKRATFDLTSLVNSVPGIAGKGMDLAERAIGGPNPLTATLLGGALGAGIGYGGGWLGHKLLPQ